MKKSKDSIYKFIDSAGTFTIKNPNKYPIYFPLTDSKGAILSSVSPNLAGDIKSDNDHFLTPPANIEDLRGNLLCRRDFFIKTNNKTIRVSLPYNDTLEAGLLYHKITKKYPALTVEVINFIPYNIAAEVMLVKVKNTSKKSVTITPTSFIPLYGRSEKCLRDHRHVSSLLNRIDLNKFGVIFGPTMIFDEEGHKINKTKYFSLGYENKNLAPVGQFPTLDYFCGKGDLLNPDAIEKNIAPATKYNSSFDGKEVCSSLRFKAKVLKPKQESQYILISGITNDIKTIKKIFSQLNTPKKVSVSLDNTKKYWRNYLSQLKIDFKDKDLNGWLLWVKLQPTLRKLFGCSFLPHFDYGKGGRGWRDLWQDALTLLLTEPEKSLPLILNSFKGVRIDGSNATIITKDNSFLSDRNKISRVWMDHGIWPYLTTKLYLHRTNDIGLLLKDTTYFCDHLLKRAKEVNKSFKQRDYLLRNRNGKIYKGSILEHLLVQNLVQFFNVGSHNIIRLENADWNDGLDMAAQRGESVAFTFMYAHNLKNLCEILKKLKRRTKAVKLLKELKLLLDSFNKRIDYNNYKQKQKRLDQYLEKVKYISGKTVNFSIDKIICDLEEKSSHIFGWLNKNEWLKEGFFNGYYDNNGVRVEGTRNKKIRMMLPSQVFALMSGGVNTKRHKQLWTSIKKHLKDKILGGFRLNTNFGDIYPQLGRAFGFSYGDKENGAVFSHMAVMLGYSLYSQGLVKEGQEVLRSIYEMAINPCSKIPPIIPEYFNNEGKGLYLYLTGSASWYTYTLVEQVLGIQYLFGDLLIKPKLSSEDFKKNSIEVTFAYRGKMIKLSLVKRSSKRSSQLGIDQVSMEGKKMETSWESCLIPYSLISKLKKKKIGINVILS